MYKYKDHLFKYNLLNIVDSIRFENLYLLMALCNN